MLTLSLEFQIIQLDQRQISKKKKMGPKLLLNIHSRQSLCLNFLIRIIVWWSQWAHEGELFLPNTTFQLLNSGVFVFNVGKNIFFSEEKNS